MRTHQANLNNRKILLLPSPAPAIQEPSFSLPDIARICMKYGLQTASGAGFFALARKKNRSVIPSFLKGGLGASAAFFVLCMTLNRLGNNHQQELNAFDSLKYNARYYALMSASIGFSTYLLSLRSKNRLNPALNAALGFLFVDFAESVFELLSRGKTSSVERVATPRYHHGG